MYRYIGNSRFESQSEAALEIGISPSTLSRILNQKQNCSKVIAYAITKHLDSEKEIDNFFERVD